MFKDRKDGGTQLSGKLKEYIGQKNVLVVALPRGRVVTGVEIAAFLEAPLDVLIVREIGHPWQPELAVGAISETGSIVYNEEVISSMGVTKDYLRGEAARQREEIARRQQLYRGGRKLVNLRGKTVILVDDGVATGATMKAAVETVKREQVGKLVVAVPVAPSRDRSGTAKDCRCLCLSGHARRFHVCRQLLCLNSLTSYRCRSSGTPWRPSRTHSSVTPIVAETYRIGCGSMLMHIDSYSFGQIVIDARAYASDVIIYSDRVDAAWWRKEGHRLHPEDIAGRSQ